MTAIEMPMDLKSTVMPLKKVLIALDYDPTAQRVAEKGFSLAKAMNAEVILLHVVAEDTYYSSLTYSPIMGFNGYINSDPGLIINTEELKKASMDFLEKSKQHLGDENIQTMVAEGDFSEAILESARKMNVDLIVMGSLSKRWLEQVLMGSVTEKVFHKTTIPLLIIPTREQKK
jgi:nucleotide-binding universal stress UspA family protein